MTISRRGEIDLELGDKTLALVFKYETLISIEEAMGGVRSIDEIYLSGTISRIALTEAVRAGMEVNYKKKSRKQVAKMIGNAMESDEKAYERISRVVVVGVLIANGASREKIEDFKRQIGELYDEEVEELSKEEIKAIAENERGSEDPTEPVALTSTG